MQSGETPTVSDPFKEIQLPDITKMQLDLEQLVQQGVLTPEQADAALVEQSDMNGISTDPRLRQAQMDALSGLEELSEGGLSASDRANLNRIRTGEETASRGAREAILQNAQARGLGGSGLELMSQMQSQQDSATRASQRDMDVAAMAQDRALQALIQAGQMGGNIQAQDFGQQSQIAQANDAISKFNAQNQQQVNLANQQANNAAQGANLAARQSIADQNVGLRNQQQMHNKNLIQQNFNNQIARAGGTSGTNQFNATAQGQNSQNQANANNQMIGAGLNLATYGGYGAAADANKKKQGG